MMGNETLAQVRARLATALADPQAAETIATERSEVVDALLRFLNGEVGRTKPGTAAAARRKPSRSRSASKTKKTQLK